MNTKLNAYGKYFGREGLLDIINHYNIQDEKKIENFKNEEIANLYFIKNQLIHDFTLENISCTDLENYIERYGNSFGAGLASTVMYTVSEGNKELIRAKEIALEQEYGFLAYEGKKLNELNKKQGWFSLLESSKECSGNSMFKANIKNIKRFHGFSGESAIIKNAMTCFGQSLKNSNIINAGNFHEQSGRYATVNLAMGCMGASLFRAQIKYALRCKGSSLNQAEIKYGKLLGKKVLKNANIKYCEDKLFTKLYWKFTENPFEKKEIKETYEKFSKYF